MAATVNVNPTSVKYDIPTGCTEYQFFKPYSSDFQPALDLLMQDAEVVDVLKEIVKNQGKKIYLKFDLQIQPASYNFDTNTITLSNSYRQGSLQEQVAFLFFELQNARNRQNLQDLFSRVQTLESENFVRAVEEHEFTSALATHHLMKKYINEGIFTRDVPFFYIPLNFTEHYLLQQLNGHAQEIAARVNRLVKTQNNKPYQGTWSQPLTTLQVPVLKLLLSNKTALDISDGMTEDEKHKIRDETKKMMTEIDSYNRSNPQVYALWANAHQIIPLSYKSNL